MKIPFGTEVDLGPGHLVLDGVPAVREMGTAAHSSFGPCLLWPWSPISATAELLIPATHTSLHKWDALYLSLISSHAERHLTLADTFPVPLGAGGSIGFVNLAK